ncbi:MAG: tyrosine-type recombinase/integrase, partial [Clostridiales bacterium]|nr:tyrosine-type recombinase/integrase [Clostridiales bacterium]
MKDYFLEKQEYRNYALFVVGINTALRISDLLCLSWKDVYNFEADFFRSHIQITEQKTSKKACIAINPNCREALQLLMQTYKSVSPQDYIFFSGKDRSAHIGRNRAYHIIKQAALDNHIEGNISCHSLRKTFGYHAWKCGTPPAVIMNIYNHSSIEITKRYLSINQDDQDEVFINV